MAKDRYQIGLRQADAGSPTVVFEIDGTSPDEVRAAIRAELEHLGLLEPDEGTVTVYRPDDFDTGICVEVDTGRGQMRGTGEQLQPSPSTK